MSGAWRVTSIRTIGGRTAKLGARSSAEPCIVARNISSGALHVLAHDLAITINVTAWHSDCDSLCKFFLLSYFPERRLT
jgi:hypothetical protein